MACEKKHCIQWDFRSCWSCLWKNQLTIQCFAPWPNGRCFAFCIQEFHLWQFCIRMPPTIPDSTRKPQLGKKPTKYDGLPFRRQGLRGEFAFSQPVGGAEFCPTVMSDLWKRVLTHVKQSHQFLMFAFGVCSFFFCPENLQINVFDTDLVEFPLFFKFRSFIHFFHVRYANR